MFDVQAAMTPRVSVIIPSYNCAPYIRETIDSVLSQSFSDLELLVVDDASTDETCQIVESYGAAVRLIRHATNVQVCASRNHGLREARGQYVCFMDHDDYWFPDKLDSQVRLLEQHPEAGVVFSEFTLWFPDGNGQFPAPHTFRSALGAGDGTDPDYSGWIYHQFLLDCWMLTSTALFRRDVFDRCGVFDESLPYSEDWDLWLRMAREYPFLKMTRSTTLYRQHPGQGNRRVREVDYRTRLLAAAERRWGLASPDGRFVPRQVFLSQLARYHAAYGRHRLQAGHRGPAIRSFARAWATDPRQWKYPAYLLATLFGWKPEH